jgi:hypothetical protein
MSEGVGAAGGQVAPGERAVQVQQADQPPVCMHLHARECT